MDLRRRRTEEPYLPLPEYVEPEAEISTVEAGDLKLDSFLYYSTYAWGHGQSLYSIDLSQMSVSTESHLTSDIPITRIVVRPVLVFGTEWPRRMCCVRNDDCIYFFGGTLHNPDNDRESVSSTLTFRVRIADIEFHRKSCLDDPNYLIDEKKVVDVGMMHMGKPYPYSFVAEGKIYVISLHTRSDLDVARFEAYTPGKDCWEVLSSPIFESEVISDLVFTEHRKVVLGTSHEGYYCYDFVDDQWTYLNLPILTGVGTPRSHGAFFPISEDNIETGGFWFVTTNHYPYVSVCGPTTGVNTSDRHHLLSLMKGSYKRFDGFSYRLMTYEPSYRVTKFLSYLGNGNFCLLCWGESADYETVDKPIMMELRVVIFRVTPNPDSDAINFTPQIVRVAHLVMDKQGSSRDMVDDCFTIRKDDRAGLMWLGER